MFGLEVGGLVARGVVVGLRTTPQKRPRDAGMLERSVVRAVARRPVDDVDARFLLDLPEDRLGDDLRANALRPDNEWLSVGDHVDGDYSGRPLSALLAESIHELLRSHVM